MLASKDGINAGGFLKVRDCAVEIAGPDHHMVDVNSDVRIFRPRHGVQGDKDDKDDCSLRAMNRVSHKIPPDWPTTIRLQRAIYFCLCRGKCLSKGCKMASSDAV